MAVTYEERATSPKARPVVLAACVVATLGFGLFGVGSFLDGVALGVLLSVLLGGIALLTLFSMERYGRIRLSGDVLRVGRDRLPVADLDRTWLLGQVRVHPGTAARWPQSAEVSPGLLPGVSSAPLLGGAYGVPGGATPVVLMLRDGTHRTVAARRPADLLDALLRATAA